MLAWNKSQQLILTGAIGAGKSSAVQKFLQQNGIKVAGFINEKVIVNNIPTGYAIRVVGGESRVFAHRDFSAKPQFAGFGVDLAVFEDFGCDVLKRAVQSGLPILMDELGVMEQNAQRFCAAARAIISGDKPYLVVIQQRALNFWLGGIRHGEVVTVPENIYI